jgi:diketogulonate reductase-like aldo/keto reductase
MMLCSHLFTASLILLSCTLLWFSSNLRSAHATTKKNDRKNQNARLIYGTAWKERRTADLVHQAIIKGFRHIDTACQPKHYHEAGVGEGWKKATQELGLSRSDIWLQTKYTSMDGHDFMHPIPYGPEATKENQVKQSLEQSLQNLQTDYVDSLIMHGPEGNWEDMFKVWKTMEDLIDSGYVKQIGISNFYDLETLRFLYENARIKPSVVQNRFHDENGYDVAIRKFCIDHEIEYQTFWTLSSKHFTSDKRVQTMAKYRAISTEQLLYALVIYLGHAPLSGTTSNAHMGEDIDLLRRIKTGEVIIYDEDVPMLLEILGVQEPREEL